MSVAELKVLKALGDLPMTSEGLPTSAVGYLIWETADPMTRKSNPSPQGMALLAGRFLYSLDRRGLVWRKDRQWKITQAGRDTLNKMKEAA